VKFEVSFPVFTMLLLIAGLIIIPYSFDSVFAKHYDEDDIPLEEGRERLRVYTIFASHQTGCSNYDEDKQTFFNSLTHQILRKYNFQTTALRDCVEVTGNLEFDRDSDTNNFNLTLDKALKKAYDWHFDLLIIIFDEKLSEEYHKQSLVPDEGFWLGHARWGGDYRQIVITTLPPTLGWISEHVPPLRSLHEIEEQRGAWILSHELAHFALQYLGYPHHDYVDYVHDTHDEYYRCEDTNFRNDFCHELYFPIKRVDDYGNVFWIKAMKPPYDDIKRWKQLPEKTYSYTETPRTITVSTGSKATEEGDTIWINGKVTNPISNLPVNLRFIDPSGRMLINQDLRLNYYDEYRISFKADSSFMTLPGTYTAKATYLQGSRDQIQDVTYFSHTMPSKIVQPAPITSQTIINSDCDAFYCTDGKVVGFLGFQYTANGIKNNSSNLKEGDEVCVKYFLSYSSKDRTKHYPIPYEKIKVGRTILNGIGEPLTNTQFNYYTVTESGNFEICRSLKMYSESYWKNGYKYEVFFEGNSKYAANQGRSLTLFFESNPNLDIVPITPKQPTPVVPQQPEPIIIKYSGKLELANLRFEQSGISTATFVMDEKVKVTYLVKNSQKTAQNVFLLVEAINESGKSEEIALKSSIIQPEEETPYLQTWRPVETGEYKIKVSVLDSTNHDIELAPPLERLVTVQYNLEKYRFLKAHTGIQLGNTCITMIKNNLTTNCPTYEELLLVFSDTSNRRISGDFVVKDGYLQRDNAPYLNQFEYYRTETKELMFIDPPSDMLGYIKLIIIEPSMTEYKIDGQTITNNTLLLGTARSENSNCSEVRITATDWHVLLGDTVNYVEHNCDKAFTNYDTIKKKSWPRITHDITTSYKYQYDLWLKNAIEECGKNYCIPK